VAKLPETGTVAPESVYKVTLSIVRRVPARLDGSVPVPLAAAIGIVVIGTPNPGLPEEVALIAVTVAISGT
jgi:hypothetical protein